MTRSVVSSSPSAPNPNLAIALTAFNALSRKVRQPFSLGYRDALLVTGLENLVRALAVDGMPPSAFRLAAENVRECNWLSEDECASLGTALEACADGQIARDEPGVLLAASVRAHRVAEAWRPLTDAVEGLGNAIIAAGDAIAGAMRGEKL